MVDNPIIIISLPRSGSSMTAGIFARHGVWVGPYKEGDGKNAKGYFESLPFKHEIIKTVGRIVHKGILAPKVEGWKETALKLIRANGYDGGPWLVKHSAMYYPLWHEFDAKYICVRRDPESIKASGKASGYLTNEKAIKPHIEAMDHVRDHLGGVDVFTDDIVRGNFESLRNAFRYTGIPFVPAIADDFVDPNLWHH